MNLGSLFQRGAPERGSTRVYSGLTRKYLTRKIRNAGHKCSSLFSLVSVFVPISFFQAGLMFVGKSKILSIEWSIMRYATRVASGLTNKTLYWHHDIPHDTQHNNTLGVIMLSVAFKFLFC
jgi:hypothetical protein